MFVEVLLLIAVTWLGVLSKSSPLARQHTLMAPAMVIPTLFRLDLYIGKMGHHAQPVKPAPSGATQPVSQSPSDRTSMIVTV